MIYGQTVRYRRRANAYTADEQQGASVAHADLLTAIMQYASIEEAHIYDVHGSSPGGDWHGAVDELRQRFPSKPLRVKSAYDLLNVAPGKDQVIYESGLF